MSDYQDFCEMFGGEASDPDFFDNWLQEYASVDAPSSYDTKDILPAGKLVHIVKLIATKPAKPVGIIWNKTLTKPLECNESNHLYSTDHEDPASWFLRNGFTVRSSKVRGHWYQVVFKKDDGEAYLTIPETKEYENICSELNPKWVNNLR